MPSTQFQSLFSYEPEDVDSLFGLGFHLADVDFVAPVQEIFARYGFYAGDCVGDALWVVHCVLHGHESADGDLIEVGSEASLLNEHVLQGDQAACFKVVLTSKQKFYFSMLGPYSKTQPLF